MLQFRWSAKYAIFENGGTEYEQSAIDCFVPLASDRTTRFKLNQHDLRADGCIPAQRPEVYGLNLSSTPRNRGIRDDITSGAIQYCSIAYAHSPFGSRWIGATREIVEATLKEISILRGRRPARYGTSVWVEA